MFTDTRTIFKIWEWGVCLIADSVRVLAFALGGSFAGGYPVVECGKMKVGCVWTEMSTGSQGLYSVINPVLRMSAGVGFS